MVISIGKQISNQRSYICVNSTLRRSEVHRWNLHLRFGIIEAKAVFK